MKRSQFISTLTSGSALVLTGPLLFANKPHIYKPDPQLDKELVQKFVGKSHSDMDAVKAMLEENPALINAAHDWKYGDFETALGAASHVGHKDLAQYLLDNGAQANIFTAALFGKLELVKGMVTAFPNTLNAKGPHGFTLLHHAIKGGEQAAAVAQYLESKGLSETQFKIY